LGFAKETPIRMTGYPMSPSPKKVGPTPASLAKSGTEAAHQTALFCWAALPETLARFPEVKWLFHIPNGGLRDKITAGNMKAQGVKAGVPDIFLPVPKGRFAGLWIELKVKDNTPSEKQSEWHKALTGFGFAVSVCYSWEEATRHITYYLE
jgi:VRR-NUC domain-containing protein